jgi:phage gp16-like protein
MANEDNLKPWKKGQSGNPSGKPKGTRNRSTIIRELLEAKATDGEAGQIADQLTRALIKKAAEGDVRAFIELFDSAYGKNTDKVESKMHYTKMGSVMIQHGNEEPTALEFDIGSPPNER